MFGLVATTFLFLGVANAALSTGPCPTYPVMTNFELAKGSFPWVGIGALETTLNGSLSYKCVKNTFDIAPNKLVAAKFNGINLKNLMAEEGAATLTPIAQAPSSYDVKITKSLSGLGDLAKALQIKYHALDTDYANYLVTVVCFSDGATWHHGVGMADFKTATPDAAQLEKARTTITNAGFSADSIKTIDQSGC